MTPDAPKRPPIFLPAVLTAALTYAAHFPVGYGWLGWFALVPLLTLVRHPGPRGRIYLAAYLSGVLFYTAMLRWLATTDNMMIVAWAFLTLYGALYPVVALWLLRRLDRVGWPLMVTVPLVWTGLEFVKGNILTGFPWYLFAHTQHDFAWLIQIADLGGAWLVSFLVLAVNGLLAELWLAWSPKPRWSRPALIGQAVAVVVLLGAALGYGAYRLGEETLRPGPLVALVQTNVQQGYRNASEVPGAIRDNVEAHVFGLTDQAARLRPALIVWPETAIGGDFFHNPKDVPLDTLVEPARQLLGADPLLVPDARVVDQLGGLFRASDDHALTAAFRWKTSLLLGLNSRVPVEGRLPRHNSAVFVDRSGLVSGVYHKIHLVPFGEYAPLPGTEGLMPFSYPYMIHPGKEWPRLELQGVVDGKDVTVATFGVLICYEDTDPNIARPYGGSDGLTKKPPVDFLVNISNDGWFANSAEHAEHLAICRLCAVEMRRAIVRSVNMGISAVVDSNGRVLRPTAEALPSQEGDPATLWKIGPDPKEWQALPVREWRNFEVTAGVLLATVPLDSRESVYARWGDWLPWACWGVVLAVLALGWVQPAKEHPA